MARMLVIALLALGACTQRQRVKLETGLATALVSEADEERLGEEIDRQAARLGRRVPVLVQVNTSGEESKFGVPPEEARPLAEALARMPNLELAGMMTIAAFLDDHDCLDSLRCQTSRTVT